MLLECLAQCFREESVFVKDSERLHACGSRCCPQ
jgi:hypothetical protein